MYKPYPALGTQREIEIDCPPVAPNGAQIQPPDHLPAFTAEHERRSRDGRHCPIKRAKSVVYGVGFLVNFADSFHITTIRRIQTATP